MKYPAPSGQIELFAPDPESGLTTFGLKGGEVLVIPSGVRVAVVMLSPPLLVISPRTPQARTLVLPVLLAEVLTASFPLAQAIKEGKGAKHDA